jgi:RimJ/RimL family protein N-acetyltransferase
MPIETLDPRNAGDVKAVVDLHLKFLADSPIVSLGERFVEHVFYTKLVEDGAVRVIICRHDGQVIGFISYTPDPQGFMMKGIRKHFAYMGWIMSTSVLMKPSLVKGILSALRLVRERGGSSEPPDPKLGEVISLAVLSEHGKHVPEGGKGRVAVRLFQEALAAFKALEYERVHLLVKPDNRASNLLCSVMGCTFEKVTFGGVVTHRYTYHLNGRPDDADGAAS